MRPEAASWGPSKSAAPLLGVEVSPVNMRDAGESSAAWQHSRKRPNGGLIVTASPLAAVHRDLIIALGGPAQLPAVYPSGDRLRPPAA